MNGPKIPHPKTLEAPKRLKEKEKQAKKEAERKVKMDIEPKKESQKPLKTSIINPKNESKKRPFERVSLPSISVSSDSKSLNNSKKITQVGFHRPTECFALGKESVKITKQQPPLKKTKLDLKPDPKSSQKKIVTLTEEEEREFAWMCEPPTSPKEMSEPNDRKEEDTSEEPNDDNSEKEKDLSEEINESNEENAQTETVPEPKTEPEETSDSERVCKSKLKTETKSEMKMKKKEKEKEKESDSKITLKNSQKPTESMTQLKMNQWMVPGPSRVTEEESKIQLEKKIDKLRREMTQKIRDVQSSDSLRMGPKNLSVGESIKIMEIKPKNHKVKTKDLVLALQTEFKETQRKINDIHQQFMNQSIKIYSVDNVYYLDEKKAICYALCEALDQTFKRMDDDEFRHFYVQKILTHQNNVRDPELILLGDLQNPQTLLSSLIFHSSFYDYPQKRFKEILNLHYEKISIEQLMEWFVILNRDLVDPIDTISYISATVF